MRCDTFEVQRLRFGWLREYRAGLRRRRSCCAASSPRGAWIVDALRRPQSGAGGPPGGTRRASTSAGTATSGRIRAPSRPAGSPAPQTPAPPPALSLPETVTCNQRVFIQLVHSFVRTGEIDARLQRHLLDNFFKKIANAICWLKKIKFF